MRYFIQWYIAGECFIHIFWLFEWIMLSLINVFLLFHICISYTFILYTFIHFYLILKRFINLFDRECHNEIWRDRGILDLWFTFQVFIIVRTGPDWIQDLETPFGVPTWVWGISVCASSLTAFPGALARSGIRNQCS